MGDRDYFVRKRACDLLLMLKSHTKQEDKWQRILINWNTWESNLEENIERAQVRDFNTHTHTHTLSLQLSMSNFDKFQ
jgi:hypothetical protein